MAIFQTVRSYARGARSLRPIHANAEQAGSSPIAPDSLTERHDLFCHVSECGDRETSSCRMLSKRSIFVIGPARSGTTIIGSLINANQRALIMTEGNFYKLDSSTNFRKDFNEIHKSHGHGRYKGSYAPDFCTGEKNGWIDWLANAALYYDYLGDKIALTKYHFDETPSDVFVSFFERRFFDAKYVLALREPGQAILSTASLINMSETDALVGWLAAARVWADFIRTFPFTTTIFQEHFDASEICNLEGFLGIDLKCGSSLLDKKRRTTHVPAQQRESIVERHAEYLSEIYATMKIAAPLLPGRPRPVGLDNGCEAPADKVWRLCTELKAIVISEIAAS